MAFRIDDLVINVAPDGTDGPGDQLQPFCDTLFFSKCGCSGTPTPYLLSPILCLVGLFSAISGAECPEASREQLARLKSQLREALAEIERQEQTATKSSEPQTLEELELCEVKVARVLKTLRARKREMESRPKKGARRR